MNKPQLVVFGAGSHDLEAAARRLAEQAEALRWFSHVHLCGAKSLGASYYDDFFRIDPALQKGFGYWSWKPFLIKSFYERLHSGETLVYIDAGCELNSRGESRFFDYIERSVRFGAAFFHLPHAAKAWTKQHPLLDFGQRFSDRLQISAAVLFFTRTTITNRLIERWFELSKHDGGALLMDPLPTEPQRLGFQQHRHDQSLLSWAVFEQGFDTLADETYYEDWREGADKPVLTIRNKTGEPRLAFLMRPRWQRKLMRIFHLEPGLRR